MGNDNSSFSPEINSTKKNMDFTVGLARLPDPETFLLDNDALLKGVSGCLTGDTTMT